MTTENTHKVPNVPPLRFPEFSGEWEKKRLQEECSFFSGGTPSSSNKEYYDGDIPFIRSGEIDAQYTELFLTQKGYNSSSAKMVEVGDLLLALYGATSGEIAISNIHGAINQAILCIRSPYNNVFVKSVWEKHVQHILQAYLQGGQGNLSADIVKKLSFYFPSIREQNKISEMIALIDQRISTQNKIIEDLKTLRLATNDYLQKHSEPAFNLSFAELGTDFGGLSGKSANDFGTGYPYITYMGVYSKNFVTEADCSLVTILPNETQSKVQKGDVLFTLSSETPEEVCYGSVYVGNVKEVYLNSFCFGVHITNSNVYSPYLAYFVNSTLFRKAVFPLAQGSTRFNLQKSDFLKKKFAFPSKEKQIEIYNTLQALDNKLQIEIALLDKYRVQKQYFLQQMFI